MDPSSSRDDYEEGDLEMDLPQEFDGEMPELAGEEIVDSSLMDADDSSEMEIHEDVSPPPSRKRGYSSHHSKPKTQAQSTYMMEKSFEKGSMSNVISNNNKKVSSQHGPQLGKGSSSKNTKKDKGV
jgi:hypothetical protein